MGFAVRRLGKLFSDLESSVFKKRIFFSFSMRFVSFNYSILVFRNISWINLLNKISIEPLIDEFVSKIIFY